MPLGIRIDRGDDRGVSPIVGTVVLLAIMIALAGVFASLAMGFGTELQSPAPTGKFDPEYVASGEDNTDNRPYVTITHEIGRTADADNILIKDDAGNTIAWDEVWTGGPKVYAGEYVHIDGFGSDGALEPICEEGQTYWIIFRNEDGKTLLVNKWSAPSDPDLPPGAASDSDNDGIPDWC
ncbi:MAG: type IV pilin N-terminal domain-containing protein [Halobacteriales archaeon]